MTRGLSLGVRIAMVVVSLLAWFAGNGLLMLLDGQSHRLEASIAYAIGLGASVVAIAGTKPKRVLPLIAPSLLVLMNTASLAYALSMEPPPGAGLTQPRHLPAGVLWRGPLPDGRRLELTRTGALLGASAELRLIDAASQVQWTVPFEPAGRVVAVAGPLALVHGARASGSELIGVRLRDGEIAFRVDDDEQFESGWGPLFADLGQQRLLEIERTGPDDPFVRVIDTQRGTVVWRATYSGPPLIADRRFYDVVPLHVRRIGSRALAPLGPRAVLMIDLDRGAIETLAPPGSVSTCATARDIVWQREDGAILRRPIDGDTDTAIARAPPGVLQCVEDETHTWIGWRSEAYWLASDEGPAIPIEATAMTDAIPEGASGAVIVLDRNGARTTALVFEWGAPVFLSDPPERSGQLASVRIEGNFSSGPHRGMRGRRGTLRVDPATGTWTSGPTEGSRREW